MDPASRPSTRRSARKAKVITDDEDIQEIIPVEDQEPLKRSTKQIARKHAPRSFVRPLKTIEIPEEEEVRAPIPQQQGVLSGGDPFALMSNQRQRASSSDFFTDLRTQYKEQTIRIKQDAKRSHQQAFLDDAANLSQQPNNKPRLSELYAAPEKIMTQGCFDDVRTKAVKKARWLLVNIHKYDEFVCQLFMRECLKHQAVQEIISENFVFWHVDFDSKEGLRYITHYKVDKFPHLAVIDPRTGEKIETYSELTPIKFCDIFTTFLAERPSYDPKALEKIASTSSKSLPPPSKTERQGSESSGSSVQIIDPEEEELKKAIELSKKEEEERKRKAGEIIDIDDILYEDDEGDSQEPETEEKSVVVIEEPKPEVKTEIKAGKLDPPTVNEDAWKDFLGLANDPSLTLKIRVPTGAALELSLPNTSQLQAVFVFLAGRGFGTDKYDTIIHFQKKNLSLLSPETLLKDAGLSNRELLIVSEKE